jgi:hypothetical protein
VKFSSLSVSGLGNVDSFTDHWVMKHLLLIALLTIPAAGAADPSQNFASFRTMSTDVTWTKSHDVTRSRESYVTNTSTPLASWFMPLSRLVENTKSSACQWAPHLISDIPERYFDGEVPCGMVGDQQLMKTIYQVNLPPLEFEMDGWIYAVDKGAVDVSISRSTLNGPVSDTDLNSLTVVERQSSILFGDDIRIQNDGRLLTVCTRTPGLSIVLHYGSRTVHGYKIKNPKVTFEEPYAPIDQGSSYLNSRSCFSMKLDNPAVINAAKVEIQGLAVGPEPKPANQAEAKIAAFDMQHIHEQLMKDQIHLADGLESAMDSGEWAPRLMAEHFTLNVGRHIATRATSVLERVGTPLLLTTLRNELRDRCHILEMDYEGHYNLWTDNMRGFCQDHIDKVGLEVIPLDVDQKQQKIGCYSGSADIADLITPENLKRWWTRRCRLNERLNLTLPDEVNSYQHEFEVLLGLLGRVPATHAWDVQLEKQEIDGYEFWQVLDQLQHQGQHQLAEQDWNGTVPEALAAVRMSER